MNEKLLGIAKFAQNGSQALINDTMSLGTLRQEEIAAIRERKMVELDAAMSVVIERAVSELLDRVNNGDEVIGKDGETVRIKVKAIHLANIVNALSERQERLRIAGDQLRAGVHDSNRLDVLRQRLRDLNGDVVSESDDNDV